jgi:hypothetical protein
MTRPHVRQQDLSPAAQVQGPLAGHQVPRPDEQIRRFGRLARIGAVAYGVRAQLVAVVDEYPVHAHRPEDLDPREGRRPEDMVEVRVREREMGHPATPEEPLRLRTQPYALPQARPRVDHERRPLAHDKTDRAVPHGKTAPPDPGCQLLPPRLRPDRVQHRADSSQVTVMQRR